MKSNDVDAKTKVCYRTHYHAIRTVYLARTRSRSICSRPENLVRISVLLFSWVHECCKSLKFTFPNLWIGIGIIALLVEFSLVCFCICAMWLLSDDELSLLVLVGSVLSLVSCDNDKPANNCLYHNALIVPCFKLEA
jgi:hypothetical protein